MNKRQDLQTSRTVRTSDVSSDPSASGDITSPSWTRRGVLAAGTATVLSMAGCLGDSDDGDSDDGDDDENDVLPDLPRVESPPEAVYVPSHREAMAHIPTIDAGEFAVSPMISYPHRFWTVSGANATEVTPDDSRGIHLMFTPWDRETEQVLPMDAGAEINVMRDGDPLETVSPWPMISQSMGFHFGDNIGLPEDGEYMIEIDLPPIATRKSGAFAGRFEEGASASFTFTYDQDLRQSLIENVEYLDEDVWGERGAIEPGHGMGVDIEASAGGHDDHDGEMEDGGHGDHDMAPFSALPAADDYPGNALGTPTSHDAHLVVQHLETFEFGEDGYLVVSPRTPYNRVPLADMAISVEGAVEGTLTQTLDPELGLHYGIEADLSPGDAVQVVIDGPPQVSRHTGYETAFLDMADVEVTVPE